MGRYGAYGCHLTGPQPADHWHVGLASGPVAPSVDLRTTGLLPPVWDQGQLGSCTAHGSSAAYSYDLAKQGGPTGVCPSRLFVYYNTRIIEGTVSEDSGATIADAVKSLNRYGCPPETDWPYDTGRFTVKPPAQAYTDGLLAQAVAYKRVPADVMSMRACLTAGLPIVIGFTVFDSFESEDVARTGVVPMPAAGEQALGGHCVLVVGYRPDGTWIIRNSWGTGWGDAGYAYFPQAYLTDPDLASDFWTVEQVEPPSKIGPVRVSWWRRLLERLRSLFT